MEDDSLTWSVIERDIAYSCPGFDVIREIVELPDGGKTDFDYIEEPPGVVIIPITPADEVVVIEEWRQAVKRRNRGFPAGTAEPHDTDLVETARRELLEETGYEAGEITPLGTFEPANGLAAIEHHYFVASECVPAGEPDHDHDETIRVETAEWDELVQASLAGELRDGRTVLGVLFYEAVHADR